ncbi:MAG: YciI family protein [Verrucomicrobiota bacterium JB022]|nr:YciI family protein [Verrucomicrobiota bacterium JB022]
MQYLLMICLDREAFDALPQEERIAIHRDCGAWHEELVRSGHTLNFAGLHGPSAATTIRQRGGQTFVTDGPYIESKELLGGFEWIQADNLDEAIAIASRFPGLRAGIAVEVRPVVSDHERGKFCPKSMEEVVAR